MAEFAILSVIMMGVAYGTGRAANDFFVVAPEKKLMAKWASGLITFLGSLVLLAMSVYLVWKLIKLSSGLTETQRAILPLGWMWISRVLVLLSVILLGVCGGRSQIGWIVAAVVSVFVTFIVMYVTYSRSREFREAVEKNATVSLSIVKRDTPLYSRSFTDVSGVHDDADIELTFGDSETDIRSV